MGLRSLPPLLKRFDNRIVKPPEKKAEPFYLSPEYRKWRELVVERAGRRCEALNAAGGRCWRSEPEYRMYADHIREVKDGGAKFDPANGRCLCSSHHVKKTNQARARRHGLLSADGVRS